MMDPAKLKVVELRAELSKRGLDTKGNKPVLVERLRKALEEATGDSIEEEAAEVDSSDENVAESAQKDTREKTPEPMTPNRTTGRSSRSTASVTPTKTIPVRGSPKIVLTPLSEKQISPTKSPLVEKTEKPVEKIETTSKEREIVEKQEEADEPSSDTTMKISMDISESETIVPDVTDAVMDKIELESEEPVRDTEEQVTLAKDDNVESSNVAITDDNSNEAIPDDTSNEAGPEEPTNETLPEEPLNETVPKESSNEIIPDGTLDELTPEPTISEVFEHTSEITGNTEVRKDDEESEEQTVAEETTRNVRENEVDEEIEEMEADPDNHDFAEAMESKTEFEDKENVITEKNDTIEDSSNIDETMEAKPDIELKKEIAEEQNVDNALQSDEQLQNVEMKDVKVEAEDETDRDTKDRDRKDRKDRKRKRSSSPQEEKTKSPPPSRANDEPDLKEADVVLSWYDSDLNLVIDKESFLSATAMHNDGFGYIWAGARASYGFTEGKVFYETKITEYCEVNLQDEQSPHVLRAGWSVQGTSMQLGEEPLTYGFGGTGKISSGNKFSDYGTAFGKDDVIGCYVDFTDDLDVIISYTINGKNMGRAFTVSKHNLDGKPLYPHVLTKNCTFVCNFGQEKPWSEEILDDYVPVGAVDLKNRVHGPRRPEKIEECEIVMMCGLPAAGKTVWATKYAENNPDKMYNVLGTNSLIEKMKVIGLPRRRNYHGRWEVLIDKCTRCLNKLLEMASQRRRNYILDQTNVYPSAQRRKMRNFYGYQRRAVVIVPTDEEFKSRTAKRTASEGDVVPDSAVLEMKANFSPPVVGDTFDIVEWVELPAEEGKKLIEKYNKEGTDAGYGQQQANKRPRFERSDNHRDNRDTRQTSRDSRDSRDHRDRRNNYPDRNRTSTWRGGSNSGGWRDRQPRPVAGHVRHGGGSGGSGGGYGSSSGSGWRGRGGSAGGPTSSYRPSNDRRAISGHDRRTSGTDRNRSVASRQGSWGSANSYQNSQPSGGWSGSSQSSGNWQGNQSQQQSSWGSQPGGWGQQQQQWGSGNWKSYGQGNNYSQGNYSQQGYGNGNWGSWNQQYYNQYWDQQQSSGQTSAASSQAANTSSSTPTGNSTASTDSTYSNYSSAWQGYTQSYGYSAESSNTNAQQQK